MSYVLGVDLGTTYCAAAVNRGGRVEIVTLGNRSSSVPSVAHIRENGEVLVGEAAERRAASDPQRSAREFKRRVSDPVPLILGGQPFSAEQLMAHQLPPIIRLVTDRQGSAPDALTLTVPANWSEHRRAVFLGALPTESLPPLNIITEPEAAAIHYANNERIEPGEVVAVYDLGGGTFDAAILRRTADGFEVLGTPEGIDRLGGIDFDAAVFSHVDRLLDGQLSDLDINDPIVGAGLAQLRQSCVEAKEALSEESDTEIPVMLPGLRTEIRMTRAELEAMIRPVLSDSVGALRRALSSAGVSPEDVTVVLLVGGSSRIPLVAQLVGSELGRPVAVDTHPKHAIALGAAMAPHPAVSSTPDSGPDAGAVAAVPVLAAEPPVETPSLAPETPDPVPEPVVAAPEPVVAAAEPAPVAAAVEPAVAATPAETVADSRPAVATAATPGPFVAPEKKSPPMALIGGAVGLIALIVVGYLALTGGDDPDPVATAASTTEVPATTEATETTEAPSTTEAPTTTAATTTEAPTTTETPTTTEQPTTTTAAPDLCDFPAPFVCIDSVSANAAGQLELAFTADGFNPDTTVDHIHFYLNVGSPGDNPLNAGVNGPNPGSWVIWDTPNPATPFTVAEARDQGATMICALVADSRHNVGPATGMCLPLDDVLAA